MEYLRTYASPQLRNPVLIAAFAGWNDASEVATFGARYLVEEWGARKLADIDPEEFFVFTEARPYVRIAGRFQRRIDWPANEFYFYTNPDGPRDAVILIGTEPHLKWRTFTDLVTGFCRERRITTVVTLGGLTADVPHTMPVRVSGTASPSGLARRLRRLGVEATRYEGPTGIVGVLNVACARRRLATASLWAMVPEYLSASPNPQGSLAILERLSALIDIDIDLTELRLLGEQFERQVGEILADNPDLQAYVQELEEQEEEERPQAERARGEREQEPLPSGEELIRELEEYLRRRRGQAGYREP